MRYVAGTMLFLFIFSAGYAQKIKPSFDPENALGIMAGYHFRSGNDFAEFGISGLKDIGREAPIYLIHTLSYEFGKLDNKNLSGITYSISWNGFISLGLASTFYTNFKSSHDFNRMSAFSVRPMIGLGAYGFQLIYEYDLFIDKPNFDFGSKSRIALRVNIGLIELKDK